MPPKTHRCRHCFNNCAGGSRTIAGLEKDRDEWKDGYKKLRAAINAHMDAVTKERGHSQATEIERRLWSILDRA